MCNCYSRFQEMVPSLDIFNDNLQSRPWTSLWENLIFI
jgi:hypothetical protein